MSARFLLAANLLLAAAALGLAYTPPVSAAPAGHIGASAARLSEPSGGFSYVPPAGWKIRTFPGLKYKICYTMAAGGFAPNINAADETAPVGLNQYVQVSMAHMNLVYSEFHLLNQTPFVTGSGLHGVRLVSTGTISNRTMRQIFYIFPAPSSRKIIVTASWLASEGDKYTRAADGAMKTFRLL